MARKDVPITLVLPDASPIITLARVGRLDLFRVFDVPIHVVDVVVEEMKRPKNDPGGVIAAWWARRANSYIEEETLVGVGLRTKREKGEEPKTGGMGEVAVDEYATRLARDGSRATVPLVLFEDPDMLELRIARLSNVHIMNTAALVTNLHALGIVKDGPDLLRRINEARTTPMKPLERAAKTIKIRSTLRRAVSDPWER